MAITCNREKNYCIIKLSGTLTSGQIMHAFDAAVSHIDYQNGMARIWDFRQADLSILNPDTIRTLASYSLAFPRGINDVKVAFVIKRDLELGLANMFKSFAINANTPIDLFKSIEDAISWVTS